MSQFPVPCVVYRGGTSRGLFFNENDLPKNKEARHKIFLNGLDSYNLSQVNGLGSGTSHTSKVIVIGPPSVGDAHVNYTFYQIGIGEEVVDSKGTCGNLMAAVGAYVVDEGLVNTNSKEASITVLAFNTNIKKMIRVKVPVINGKAKVTGNYDMSGLQLTGEKYVVDLLNPGGGKLGNTFPLGPSSKVAMNDEELMVSVIDIVNPFVYLVAESVGLKEGELFADLQSNQELVDRLDSIRCKISVQTGLTDSIDEAIQAPAIPKISIVSTPHEYVTASGVTIKKEEVDIVAKMVSMGRFHRTFAGSGLYNLAAAALLPGTVTNRLSGLEGTSEETVVRIGHPDGIAEVRVRLTREKNDVAYVGLDRTARRIIKGNLYIPV